ncbi:hybrid sensor histidine kinase/response regulator [Litorimonas sp. RW-G-Af-16]|uniref:hybrid sensor histidine kinase/response regulator n=1 Tax=Litorimonas sp. RW-G-Af-16 TaxID=3241168 RepID=UPI00390CCCEB
MVSPQMDEADIVSNSTHFEWVSQFADMSGIGCAVIGERLAIEYTNPVFFDLLEINADGSPPIDTFLGLIDTLAIRGDFDNGSPDISKTAIFRALDDQLSSGREDAFKTQLTLPSGQNCTMGLKALGDQQVLISVTPLQTQSTNITDLHKIMSVGESGYFIYYPETEHLAFYADRFISKLGAAPELNDDIDDLWQFIHSEDLPKAKAAISAVLNTQRQTEVTIRVTVTFDQVIWVRAKITPQLAENGTVEAIYCFFTDVTQTLRIQNQMRQKIDDVEKSLKAKTSFLGRLSHEIRTPMNAVIGISDALIHHHGDPVILPKLELIQTSAEKIVRIVDETLQHSKLDEDKIELDPRTASPKDCVQTVFQLWEPKAEKDEIQLSCQIDPSVPDELFFDDHRWEQCINNLVSNAVKFTAGGKVQIVLTTLEKNGEKQLILAVKDNGIGITPEEQISIFEAYTQADRTISGRFGGTGLGMHITKRIIELMGGKISVRSAKGQGSVFALSLPIPSEEQNPIPEKTSDLVSAMLEDAGPKQSDYAHLTVLVADDNATNHMVVNSLLGSIVKEIVTADDGQAAIDVLATQHVDVVLMDIHMPGMDGIEATLSIRGSNNAWSNVPIIALTADPQYQQKRLCKNIGMNWALAKPVKLNEILSALDSVMSSDTSDQRNIA